MRTRFRKRRFDSSHATFMRDFEQDFDFLLSVLKSDAQLSLLRATWDFTRDAGIGADLPFPPDLADNDEAREVMKQRDKEIERYAALTPAEKWRLDVQLVETVRRWLAENPDAATLLDIWRRDCKRPHRPDRTPRAEPARPEDPEARTRAVEAALLTLDPNDDSHWTRGGAPQTTVIAWLSGVVDLTREELNVIAPGLNRESARSKELTTFG